MDLLSKKDLLAQTGISYGQLYRWKRERLIPEEWFIKQASYTGQETFFPKEKIIERVTAILEFKDKYSLEELADVFTPDNKLCVLKKDIGRFAEISSVIIDNIADFGDKDEFSILEIAFLIGISKANKSKNISAEQLLGMVKNGLPVITNYESPEISFIIFKTGINFNLIFAKDVNSIMFDKSIEIVDIVSLNSIMGKIKINYSDLFIGG